MVTRASQELGLAGQPVPAPGNYRGTRPAMAAPDPVNPAYAAVAGILQTGAELMQRAVQNEVQDAYLQGVLAQQQGRSVDEITNNPLTKPFVRGGFATQAYRAVQAKGQEEFDRWLNTEGHKYAPDDPRVLAKLTEFTGQVSDAISQGVPEGQRGEALISQVKANESLITKHNKAYKMWSAEEYAKPIRAQGNQLIKNLVKADAAQDPHTYAALSDQVQVVFDTIVGNDTLDQGMREEIGIQFINALLNEDQRAPVEQMIETGRLDHLPFDVREKIDTALRQSQNRTLSKDLAYTTAGFAQFEADFLAGKKSIAEAQDYFVRASLAGYMTVDRQMSLLKQWMKGTANSYRTRDVIDALRRRDLTGLQMLGSDAREAMQLMDDELKNGGATSGERLATMLAIGPDVGYIPKAYGEILDASIRATMAAQDGEAIHPEFVEALNLVPSLVQVASRDNPYKAQVLLEAMPESTRGAMAYVLEQAQQGVQPAEAIRKYAAEQAQIKDMKPAEKVARIQAWAEKYDSAINKEFPTGFFRALIADSPVMPSPANQSAIQMALWEEVNTLSRQERYWSLTPESLISVAAGNIRGRIVPVNEGVTRRSSPMILSSTVDPVNTFGTSSLPEVGKVLGELYPATGKDLQSLFVWDDVEKRVIHRQVNEDGVVMGSAIVDMDKVKETVLAREEGRFKADRAVHFGAPREVGGQTLTIDGRNSVGMSPYMAYNARDLMLRAAADQVATDVQGTPQNTTQAFRDSSDLALARVARGHIPGGNDSDLAPVVAAAVYTEGYEAANKVMVEVQRATQAGQVDKAKQAVQGIKNPVIRDKLFNVLFN